MTKAASLNTLLGQDTVTVAQQLIGWRLYVVAADGSRVGGKIIETEAYTQDDAASHSYRGQTPRNKIMFGSAGYIYVYFTYGMHWCMNIVTGQKGRGEAVLLRALELDEGLPIARQRRRGRSDHELANGPAKLCQALGISGEDSGRQLNKDGVLLLPPDRSAPKTKATERIGIKKDTHRLWRFVAS